MYTRFGFVLPIGLLLAGCSCDSNDDDQVSEPTWRLARADNRPGITPVAAVVADLDGDGKMDIASAWRGSKDTDPAIPGLIAVHLNNGNNQWLTLVAEKSTRYNDVNTLAVGDINEDGHPDLVVAAQDRIIYLRAPEDPRNLPGVPGTTTWEPFDLDASIGEDFKAWFDVKVGQIDGVDGPDIVAALSDDGRLVWFMAPEDPDVPADWTLQTIDDETRKECDSVLLHDLNGDTRLDVISSAPGEEQNGISWYEQPADLSEDPWVKHPMSSFAGATRIALGDLDGDGKPDLAAVSATDRRAAWMTQPATVTSRWGGFIMADFSRGFEEQTPVDVAIADIDRDGANDIVIAGTDIASLAWFKPGSDKTLLWIEHVIDQPEDFDIGLIGLGDINADNYVDLAVPEDSSATDSDDGIYWYRNPYFSTQPSTQPAA